MERVPTELRKVRPDETRVIQTPSSRWVFDHEPAKIPVLQFLSIDPRNSNLEFVKDNLSGLLINIERITFSQSALLFQTSVSGEFAFSNVNAASLPNRPYCHTHTEETPKQRWELYLPVNEQFIITHIEYKIGHGFRKFDYRHLLHTRYYGERLVVDFGNPVSGRLVYMPSRFRNL